MAELIFYEIKEPPGYFIRDIQRYNRTNVLMLSSAGCPVGERRGVSGLEFRGNYLNGKEPVQLTDCGNK
jgi:hypothetical protein